MRNKVSPREPPVCLVERKEEEKCKWKRCSVPSITR
jgi:hypothetical protein